MRAGAGISGVTALEGGTRSPPFNVKDLSGWTADIPAKDEDKNAPPSFIVRNRMLVSLGTPEFRRVAIGPLPPTGH